MSRRRISFKLAISFATIVASFVAVAAVVLLSMSVIQTKWDTTNRAQDVLETTDDLTKTMLDLSGQIRGFMLTQDPAFAVAAAADQGRAKLDITALKRFPMTPEQRERLTPMAQAVEAELGEASQLVTRVSAEPTAPAGTVAGVRGRVNRHELEAFKAAAARFQDAVVESRSMAERRAAIDKAIATARWALFVGVGLVVLYCILLACGLARRVAVPFRRLSAAMAEVAVTKNFSIVPVVHASDELGRLAKTFNTLVGELRTYDAQLKTAAADAEAASEAKSQFLAHMSHEIRTPLNGMLGMAQVMAINPLEPAQKERLDVIQNSGAALLTILNDLLDVSKIEAGKIELEDLPFEIEEVADGAYSAFTGVANAGGTSLSLSIDPEAEGRWQGDAVRIRQILYNLISNALKFTRDGSVDIRVGATPSADGGKMLVMTVADTGIGIAPEALPKLFDKFVQADTTITRRFGGTGLGLSISRSMVELMQGTVEIESELGKGTTFRIVLPLPWLGPSIAAASQPAAADAADGKPEGLRVLAADDNATNQLVLRTILNALGIDPVIVADGRQAVEAWAEGRFDVILMDIQMPVMDGIAAMQEIRKREGEKKLTPTPIIALSANAMKHQVAECLAAGMDGHLAKPIQMDKLYELLMTIHSNIPEQIANVA